MLASKITRVVVLYKSSLSGHRVGGKTEQTTSLKAQVKMTRSVIASKTCTVIALSFNRAGMGCTAAARPHVVVANSATAISGQMMAPSVPRERSKPNNLPVPRLFDSETIA